LDAFSQNRLVMRKGPRPWMGAICLLLAMAVFAWGTAYKLSLYGVDQHRAPAKVCTRGSDAAKSGIDHAADGRRVTRSITLVGLGCVGCVMHQDGVMEDVVLRETADLSPLRAAPMLHVRPPPVELVILRT
jgi:hypothetical protein